MRKQFWRMAVLASVLALGAPAAFAAEPGHDFEIYGGWFFPEGSALDEDFTYGARYAYNPSEIWGFGVSAGFFDVDAAGSNAVPLDSPVSLDLFLIDFSFIWYPGGGNFALFGGPGWATVDARLDIPGDDNDLDASDDVFDMHVGAGWIWNATDTFYIKPEGRVRWIDATDARYDETQWETTVAFGWHF